MQADDIIKKQHHAEALAALEDGGRPLLAQPSAAASEQTLIGMGSPPTDYPLRRGRRGSGRFKTMSMASSLGVGITSLTSFTGTNAPVGDFGQGQFGCFDDYNVVNLRARQHIRSNTSMSSPKADMYSHASDTKRNSYIRRRSYHEPSYRRSRASTYGGPISRPMSYVPPVPSLAPQPSYSANRQIYRPSFMSNGSTEGTTSTSQTDATSRRRRFHSMLIKLAELLPYTRWYERRLEMQRARA